ncbi:hypothetical protein AMS68_002264 [Peltaster fructicola]|uniref:Ketoreductase (KR) domain-containing protein n=1 Tax=Peltaster fructicola TaxID=286661 RepID=A0A6H0XPQ6_9PEZI|nr:hypothetical protein AMS68_002264 [Peltaster fructicola]
MSGTSPIDLFALIRAQLFYQVPASTASFAGQTVLVTGGNAGLGRELIKQLLEHDVDRVLLACRTLSKGETAKQELQRQTGSRAEIQVLQVDMASFASVIAFAEHLKAVPRIDAAVLNAGVWPTGQETSEGFETTLTVNLIGTYLLAHLLLPRLQDTSEKFNTIARLCLISSGLHKFATLEARKSLSNRNLLDAMTAQPLRSKADYDARYQDSKMLLNMYGQRLGHSYVQRHGKGVSTILVNPGFCVSSLDPPTTFGAKLFQRVLARSGPEGARHFLDAIDVRKAAERNGAYITECMSAPHASFIGTPEGIEVTDRLQKDLEQVLERVKPGVTVI